MRFRDIPQFPKAHYEVNITWDRSLDYQIEDKRPELVLEPDYQRGHVWTTEQQIAYVEYGLMGGESSMVITTNCPGWMSDFRGPYEVVDGLQRITAVRRFIHNEIPAFGVLCKDYEDKVALTGPSFRWRVCSLPTRKEVLKLYLLMNSGGVVHSKEEIARVRALLEQET